jgi:two-component system chemotaxis response regulator CheY
MKILVADDSQVMRRIVVRTLRQAGFGGCEVLEAGNGQEALFLAATERPDLVLSDWHLPALSGLDVLIALRASGSTVPFGFVTTEASAAVRRRADRAGALCVIPKPFTAELFRDALRGHPDRGLMITPVTSSRRCGFNEGPDT